MLAEAGAYSSAALVEAEAHHPSASTAGPLRSEAIYIRSTIEAGVGCLPLLLPESGRWFTSWFCRPFLLIAQFSMRTGALPGSASSLKSTLFMCLNFHFNK